MATRTSSPVSVESSASDSLAQRLAGRAQPRRLCDLRGVEQISGEARVAAARSAACELGFQGCFGARIEGVVLWRAELALGDLD